MWIVPKQLISDYVPDMEASSLDCVEQSQLCAQSLFVRSKHSPARTWSQKWKRDSWTQHLFGRILKPSHGKAFEIAWTSSLEVIPANHFQPQEDGKEKTTPDIFGLSSQAEFDFFDQGSVSLKTSKDISLWGCPTSSKTWQEWVTERRGAYSQRVKSAHLISGSESSSWPTARASDCHNSPRSEQGGGSIRSTANRSQLAHINEQGLEGRIQHCVPCEKEPNESATGCRSALAHANSSGGSKDRESSQLWATRSKQPSGNSRRSEPKEIGEGQSWPSRPGEQQFAWEPPRVVNSCSARQQTQWDQSKLERTTRLISESNQRQTESSMGRDADGSSDWMDHAQLFTTCDNRTDELRLLGNGVVPATAERAFRVLMEQFA